MGRRSITDLAEAVRAPTIHRTRSRQGTGMLPTRRRINRCKGNPSGHGSGSGGIDARTGTARAIADLA